MKKLLILCSLFIFLGTSTFAQTKKHHKHHKHHKHMTTEGSKADKKEDKKEGMNKKENSKMDKKMDKDKK